MEQQLTNSASRAWPMRMGAILLPLKALSRIKDADSVLPAWEELSVGEKASLLFLYLYEIDPLHAFKLFAATAEQAIPATGLIAEGNLVKWEHYKSWIHGRLEGFTGPASNALWLCQRPCSRWRPANL
eukprot:jgi/Botrbrau1/18733/Bobra.0386s0056.1